MARRRFGRGYGRDPFRRHIKPTAPHPTDARQLPLDLSGQPMAAPSPWPEHQIDLEEHIAALGKADQC